MKRIINGLRYDTETAEKICDVSQGSDYKNDFRYDNTDLYRTKSGNWFISGEGGPMSQWARPTSDGGHSSGSGIRPLTADEVRLMLEDLNRLEELERFFPDDIRDA